MSAAKWLVNKTEDGVQYSYGYDRRGNLIKEHRGDVQTRQYIYDATNHMTMGKNLENGTQTEYAYNALYMRIRNIQTIAREDGFHTREVSYLPDFLSRTDNELMAFEKGKYSLRTVFGRGYERLAGIAAMETEAAGAGVSPLEAQMPRAAGVELPGAEAVTVTPVERLYFQSDFYGSPLFASNGAIVGGVRGALIGSGVGAGAALAADFGAGTLGSAAFYGAGKAVQALAGSLSNKSAPTAEGLTISSRNSSRGNPNAINHFGEDLNTRQRNLLNKLPNYDSSTIVSKSDVNLNDLSALTAKTGDEFAMFTRGSQRMIVRGGPTNVNINGIKAQELASAGYRWSGHTHPGIGRNVKIPSPGDLFILSNFKQTRSVIYDSGSKFNIFGG